MTEPGTPRIAVFSTDAVPTRDRLPYLIDFYAKAIFKVDWRPLPSAPTPPFHASARIATVSDQISTIDYRCSGGIAERGPATARAEPDDTLIVYSERQDENLFVTTDGREFRTRRGALLVYPTNLPITSIQTKGQDTSFVGVKLPRALLGKNWSGARPDVRMFDARHPFVLLTSGFLEDWTRRQDGLSPHEAKAAGEALIRLLDVAIGGGDSRDPDARAAIGQSRVQAALALIARDLHRPDLTVGSIAERLRISPRQLNTDFAPTGLSVSRRITAMRLDLAARHLRDDPARSIADIAYASGFDSLATFYRVFKAGFGMTASEMRAAARAGDDDDRA